MQLTSNWQLPDYAIQQIWLSTSRGEIGAVSGERGEFSTSLTPDTVTVKWGGQDGAPLTQLRWDDGTLDWDGSVRLGGFVTSMHVTQLPAFDFAIAILTMEAYPLKPEIIPYLSAEYRKKTPFPAPDFLDGVDDEVNEGVTTWIAEYDNPLVGLMQDAMNQDTRLYAFGRLPDADQNWDKLFAMPILLEAVTTFMK